MRSHALRRRHSEAESKCSADVPDLAGCVATGATVAAVEDKIRQAIAFHKEGLRQDGLPSPAPWVQALPGRLLNTNVIGCTSIAAASGSSAATCATIGKMMLP